VLQSSGASCAAASAANLARQHGVLRTEAEMAALLGTTRFGTSPAQVIQGLGQLGFSCQKVFHASADAAAVRAPAVLFYPPDDVYGAGHAVFLASVEREEVVVVDPLIGRLQVPAVDLRERWKGHAVECEGK
jgi:ABC-type bacteriocin/lantibiotic exporter with double-glycine peptidase domain